LVHHWCVCAAEAWQGKLWHRDEGQQGLTEVAVKLLELENDDNPAERGADGAEAESPRW
jgi:hypothetical protein